MTRLLSIFVLSIGLACFPALQSFAAEQAQLPLIKVYKAPG